VVGDEAKKMPVKFSLEAEVVEPMGADTLVWSKIGGQEFHFIVDGTTTMNSGDSVLVGFDPIHSSIFDLDSEDRL
jgi:multiple sugar transport system ATP-binding protein